MGQKISKKIKSPTRLKDRPKFRVQDESRLQDQYNVLPMRRVPLDIWLFVFRHLPFNDFGPLRRVCKHWFVMLRKLRDSIFGPEAIIEEHELVGEIPEIYSDELHTVIHDRWVIMKNDSLNCKIYDLETKQITCLLDEPGLMSFCHNAKHLYVFIALLSDPFVLKVCQFDLTHSTWMDTPVTHVFEFEKLPTLKQGWLQAIASITPDHVTFIIGNSYYRKYISFERDSMKFIEKTVEVGKPTLNTILFQAVPMGNRLYIFNNDGSRSVDLVTISYENLQVEIGALESPAVQPKIVKMSTGKIFIFDSALSTTSLDRAWLFDPSRKDPFIQRDLMGCVPFNPQGFVIKPISAQHAVLLSGGTARILLSQLYVLNLDTYSWTIVVIKPAIFCQAPAIMYAHPKLRRKCLVMTSEVPPAREMSEKRYSYLLYLREYDDDGDGCDGRVILGKRSIESELQKEMSAYLSGKLVSKGPPKQPHYYY